MPARAPPAPAARTTATPRQERIGKRRIMADGGVRLRYEELWLRGAGMASKRVRGNIELLLKVEVMYLCKLFSYIGD